VVGRAADGVEGGAGGGDGRVVYEGWYAGDAGCTPCTGAGVG